MYIYNIDTYVDLYSHPYVITYTCTYNTHIHPYYMFTNMHMCKRALVVLHLYSYAHLVAHTCTCKHAHACMYVCMYIDTRNPPYLSLVPFYYCL